MIVGFNDSQTKKRFIHGLRMKRRWLSRLKVTLEKDMHNNTPEDFFLLADKIYMIEKEICEIDNILQKL